MDELFEDIDQGSTSSYVPKTSGATSKTTAEHARVKPSGSGLTFFMEDDNEEDFDDYDMEESLNDPLVSEKIVEKSVKQHDANIVQQDFQRELTEKYISGQMSFTEYIKQVDADEDDDDDSEEAKGDLDNSDIMTDDEEWMPGGSSRDTGDTSSKLKKPNEENSMEEFSKELKATSKQQLGRKKARLGLPRTRKKLDATLQGMIGEANVKFAKGDFDTAIKLCMEVIRNDSSAPDPYQTLSTIYEHYEEFEKSLQYALIGAYLSPPDANEWERLANMSLELNDTKQAASCLKKAIDSDTSVIKYHVTRCDLLESIGEKKPALQGYRRLQQSLKPDQGPEYLEASREIARLLHERGDVEAAKNMIASAMEKHPGHVQPEYANLLLELLIALNDYPEALDVLCRLCHVKFESDKKSTEVKTMEPKDQLKAFTKATLPADTPVDLKVKLTVTLLNLEAMHLVSPFTDQLLEYQASEFGDLMLDTCEALMSQKCWSEALKFAEKLVNEDEYSKAAAVWLLYGECLYETQKLEEAEQAYQNVVKLAPQHFEARRALSNILNKLGRPEEALHTLTQDEKAELLNPSLLYERCQLLLSEGRTEEFVKKTKLLLSRHLTDIRSREEVITLCSSRKYSQKRLTELRSLNEHESDSISVSSGSANAGPSFESESSISANDEFELMKDLCEVLFQQKRYAELQRVAFSSLGSRIFNKKEEIIKEVEFLCLISAFLNKDAHLAYNYVRELVIKDVKNSKLWNLFNNMITDSDDTRHNKFLMRLANKHTDNVAIGILNGNNCLLAGTYKYSLGEYMNVYKVERNNPLVPLMLGITFVHLACQKFSSRKHSLVVQASAFLQNYAKLRGQCQETYYNLGRAMHQLGILPAAMHYYKKVLETEPPLPDDQSFDLRREAAFNLSLMYKNSGTYDLARTIIDKYIVI